MTGPMDFGDLSAAAAEYRASRERMVDLVAHVDESTAATPVGACPAWTVKDLFAHVTGIATDLATGNLPQGDTQAWVDRQVAERRGIGLDAVIEEWTSIAPAFEAMIDERPRRWWGLTYDTVVHEHDLRSALAVGGARQSAGVALAARYGLRLVAGDLVAGGLGAVEVVIDGELLVVGEGEVRLRVEGTAFEILRTLGSRRTLDEVAATVTAGDLEVVLAGLLHMDPPPASLGEADLPD